jgi:hypothetical protein
VCCGSGRTVIFVVKRKIERERERGRERGRGKETITATVPRIGNYSFPQKGVLQLFQF